MSTTLGGERERSRTSASLCIPHFVGTGRTGALIGDSQYISADVGDERHSQPTNGNYAVHFLTIHPATP